MGVKDEEFLWVFFPAHWCMTHTSERPCVPDILLYFILSHLQLTTSVSAELMMPRFLFASSFPGTWQLMNVEGFSIPPRLLTIFQEIEHSNS